MRDSRDGAVGGVLGSCRNATSCSMAATLRGECTPDISRVSRPPCSIRQFGSREPSSPSELSSPSEPSCPRELSSPIEWSSPCGEQEALSRPPCSSLQFASKDILRSSITSAGSLKRTLRKLDIRSKIDALLGELELVWRVKRCARSLREASAVSLLLQGLLM